MKIFQTKFGRVPVTGQLRSRDRQLVCVVRGLFPSQGHLTGMMTQFPDTDFAFFHLPGMFTPTFDQPSIGTFAAAFDEVLDEIGYADITALGVSMGGLVALSMRTAQRMVLLDTPLTTSGLWPLEATLEEYRAQQAFQTYLEALVGPDYRPLLDALRVPATSILGAIPLGEPREEATTPSLVSESDRATYRHHRLVRTVVTAAGGHNVPGWAASVVVAELRRALENRILDSDDAADRA